MPKLSRRVPAYRLHKKSGQAVVSFGAKDHYLGRFGSSDSKDKYDRLISEYLGAGRNPTVVNRGYGTSVAELLDAFLTFAETFYVKDGEPTSELMAYRRIILDVVRLYGQDSPSTFGPVALRGVRDTWVRRGRARSTVNKDQRRLVRIWKWGVSEELITPDRWEALRSVEGLKKGRTKAAESVPIEPVLMSDVEATLPHLSPVVADMVRLQLLTGMRPGEVCQIRPCDIDRSADVWEYRPSSHKTEHHGRSRVIYIGPQAKEVISRYMFRDAGLHCFSARVSRQWHRDQANAARVTPDSCGNRRGKSKPKATATRQPRDYFDTSSYGHAIALACSKAWPAPERIAKDAAKVKAWHDSYRWAPNQLRHTKGTEIRRQFGLEAAQVILGHAKADVTQIYAERDAEKARAVVRQIG